MWGGVWRSLEDLAKYAAAPFMGTVRHGARQCLKKSQPQPCLFEGIPNPIRDFFENFIGNLRTFKTKSRRLKFHYSRFRAAILP